MVTQGQIRSGLWVLVFLIPQLTREIWRLFEHRLFLVLHCRIEITPSSLGTSSYYDRSNGECMIPIFASNLPLENSEGKEVSESPQRLSWQQRGPDLPQRLPIVNPHFSVNFQTLVASKFQCLILVPVLHVFSMLTINIKT